MSLDVIKSQLIGIVGSENVIDDPEVLEKYAGDHSFVPRVRSLFIVRPSSVDEVQSIVRVARMNKIPITPFSSGKDGQGAWIPKVPGILLDLSKMNRIIGLDPYKRVALIEPGVTFAQLQDEAKKAKSEVFSLGLRVLTPVELPASATVLSTYLEHWPLYSWFRWPNPVFGSTHPVLQSVDMVIGTGEFLRSSGESPHLFYSGPGEFIRAAIFGSIGTLGIAVAGLVFLKSRHPVNKVLFTPLENPEKAFQIFRELKYLDAGEEVFMMNDMDLALVLSDKPEEASEIRKTLPPWTVITIIRGDEERVEVHRLDILDAAPRLGVKFEEELPGWRDAAERILNEIDYPQGWVKFSRYKGIRNTMPFVIPYSGVKTLHRYENVINRVAERHKYPKEEIGKTLVPYFSPAGVHYQYSFHRSPDSPEEAMRIKRIFIEASDAIMHEGAVFRPYGPWAEKIKLNLGYGHIYILENLKRAMDPDNILSPGKLFGI